MSFRHSHSICSLLLATILLALAGCSLFSKAGGESSGSSKLPRLIAPRDSIQLEIVFVDRPESDPLIGEALWEKVDQIAGFSSDERNELRKHGWRVGHCSSHPPQALEELMKAVGKPESMDGDRRVSGRRLAIPSGGEIPIEVTDLIPELKIDLKGKTKTYSDAKAVLRVHVDREQDGWVQLRFVPEIHHGQNLLRPFATAEDWTRRRSQNIEPIYAQQFSMNLNVGELALVTSGETEAQQVPSAFFRSVDEAGHLQRLLVIRVANMRRMTPVFHGGGIQSAR
jgi:hypothetical protein